MIKSVNYNQSVILQEIMQLCGIKRFCADVTYGNGKFYSEIPKPIHRFDIDPQPGHDVLKFSSTEIPLPTNSLKSIVFDPPFLTYVRAAREGNGNMVMANRFGGYWRYDELEKHYRETLIEAHRLLGKKGIMIFKCQDIIHNHKMHCTHANVINWMNGMFRLKDLFILPVKHRMPIPQQKGTKLKQQRHARIYHSYFMVLEKI